MTAPSRAAATLTCGDPAHVRPERRALHNEPQLDDTIKPPYSAGTGWIQVVVATRPMWVVRRNWSRASAGVLQPRVFRGLLLRAIATAARSSALCTLRSVPFGKYWRSSPLVFSFVPRCQGLWGSQK